MSSYDSMMLTTMINILTPLIPDKDCDYFINEGGVPMAKCTTGEKLETSEAVGPTISKHADSFNPMDYYEASESSYSKYLAAKYEHEANLAALNSSPVIKANQKSSFSSTSSSSTVGVSMEDRLAFVEAELVAATAIIKLQEAQINKQTILIDNFNYELEVTINKLAKVVDATVTLNDNYVTLKDTVAKLDHQVGTNLSNLDAAFDTLTVKTSLKTAFTEGSSLHNLSKKISAQEADLTGVKDYLKDNLIPKVGWLPDIVHKLALLENKVDLWTKQSAVP